MGTRAITSPVEGLAISPNSVAEESTHLPFTSNLQVVTALVSATAIACPSKNIDRLRISNARLYGKMLALVWIKQVVLAAAVFVAKMAAAGAYVRLLTVVLFNKRAFQVLQSTLRKV
jgi:hypothetical protein